MKIAVEIKKLTERKDVWKEGEYLDLWSVPHFLSGAVLACFLHFLSLPLVYSVVLATILLIAYEIFEHIIEIEETVWNRRLDVVVGLASFVPATILIFEWSFWSVFLLGTAFGVVDSFLSFLGWSASQKASQFEQKVHTEFILIKERTKIKLKARAERKKEKLATKLAIAELKKKLRSL